MGKRVRESYEGHWGYEENQMGVRGSESQKRVSGGMRS